MGRAPLHKRSVLVSTSVLVVILSFNVLAQQDRPSKLPKIVTGPNVIISSDSAENPHAESFLAISPKDPAVMLATSLMYSEGKATAAVYVSRNGGRTWHRASSLGKNVPPIRGGDPIVYFDAVGGALFGGVEGSPVGFRIWRSADGGQLWNSVSTVPGATYDRQYLAIDRTSGRFSGRIYAAGRTPIRKADGSSYQAIGISYSNDNGSTFVPAVFVDASADGEIRNGPIADILVTSRGSLVVPFGGGVSNRFWTIVSDDGGKTFSAPRPGPQINRSTFGYRSLKSASPGRTAIDSSSGVFDDRIYIVWVDYDQEKYQVKASYSDDDGLEWSTPVIVNENPSAGDVSNPAIAVNRDGVLFVIWNDRRDDPKNACYRLYASASMDGGETFLPNILVNPKPTCPNASGNWYASEIFSYLDTSKKGTAASQSVAISGVPERFPNGGETQGLVAAPDGTFHSAWINGESGVMQLWYTQFAVNAAVHVNLPRRVDRTREMSVQVSEPSTDFGAKSLTLKISLKNQSSNPIFGPIILTLDRLKSGLGGLIVANADNGLTKRGAEWVFSLSGRRSLAPGESSETRMIRFQFDGQIPSEPGSRLGVNFRIFSRPEKNDRQK